MITNILGSDFLDIHCSFNSLKPADIYHCKHVGNRVFNIEFENFGEIPKYVNNDHNLTKCVRHLFDLNGTMMPCWLHHVSWNMEKGDEAQEWQGEKGWEEKKWTHPERRDIRKEL